MSRLQECVLERVHAACSCQCASKECSGFAAPEWYECAYAHGMAVALPHLGSWV